MALGRRVLLTVASGTLIYSGMASALGMGDITLHSALNQPLRAEIDLLDVGNLSTDDIRVVLASSSDFARVGVERPAFLQDLSFTPVIDGNRSRIRVVSKKPVREPYLNFLVEITRAKSRLLREYTVLLDPMPSAPVTVVGVAPDQAAALPVSDNPARFVPPAQLPQAVQGKRHRVTIGESLWTIASAYAGGSQASLDGFMRDIQALNPDAFAGGDAARLKAGAVLLLPDAAERAAPSAGEAAHEGADAGQLLPVAEPMVQDSSVSEPDPVDLRPTKEQLAVLRRQFSEELAASREENQQLRQMLIGMRDQLDAVTAQLAEQARPQAVASPQAEQSTPAVEISRPVDEPAIEPAVSKPAQTFPWQDWTLPGAGVLLSLLIGGWWIVRRRKSEIRSPDALMPAAATQPMRAPAVAAAAPTEMPRQPAEASVSDTDVLEAADIYLTYGRRDEALDVLLRGIERAPEQLDIRLRYLGLLAESGDVEGYSVSAQDYLRAGGNQPQLDQLLMLHPALAAAVAPVESPAEPMLDPDITFVLEESSVAPLEALTAAPTVSLAEPGTKKTSSSDSQPWLDDFDEQALSLGGLPGLLDDSESFASMRSAEELRHLEPNPEHLVRLNQAVAYIKQGDMDSACSILESLATEGDEQQRQQVNELLSRIA